MTLHEALEYGPIVANDEELDCFITANQAYLNFWAGNGEGEYTNTTCRYVDKEDGQDRVPMDELQERAEKWMEEVRDPWECENCGEDMHGEGLPREATMCTYCQEDEK